MLASIVFLIAALVIYANFIRAEYTGAINLRGQLEAKNKLLADQTKIIKQVQDLINQYKGTSQLQETVSLSIPNGEEVASLFQQINTIAKGTGLITQNFNLNILPFKTTGNKTTYTKNLGTIQLSLKLFGPYQNIKKFLEAMEQNVRIMDLVEFRLEPAGKPTETTYNFSMLLNTYYQQP